MMALATVTAAFASNGPVESETDALVERLDSLSRTLGEVTVSGQSAARRVADGHLGSENLELDRLAATPQLFGEADIVKSITLLPGVRQEGDGAGGFEVRGGNAYQNLVTLDGMTLHNPSHLMGIFSTFNDDAIARATLHKGPIPASIGGASAAALETQMVSGDERRTRFAATVGILNAKLSARGPIVKDRLTFAVAARRSYVDLFLKMIPEYRSTILNFYDVNAKLRYSTRRGDIVDVSFFTARDNMAISDLMEMRWGNTAASVNYVWRAADALRLVSTGAVSNYTTDMRMALMDDDQRMTQYIRDFSVNERLIWEAGDGHSVDFGLRSELIRVKSGDMMVNLSRQKEIRSGWQNALWAAYDGTIGERLTVSVGGRLSVFSALSAGRFHAFTAIGADEKADFSAKTYVDFEPRAALKWALGERHDLRLGASLTTQNIHGIRSTSTTFPFDRYALTSAGVKPERATLYSAAYAGMTADGAWDWSAEVYYKSTRGVYDYRDGMMMFSRVSLESIIAGGRGRGAGLELMLRKNTGRLNGWLSYTLSKTQTRIAGINDSRWYDASNDRRHDIAVAAIYSLSDRWQLSASWTFSSGRPLTAPDAKYELNGTTCYYYTSRNGYMTPSSHRLDLSATWTRAGEKTTTIWSFGIYNAYSHYSPFVIYFEDDDTKPSGTRAVQQSLFGIVPSVSYTIKF